MEEIIKCIICGNTSFKTFLSCKDHFLTKQKFNIQKCENCGFLFTNPRPYEKDLDNYYKSEEYISHSNKKKGLINSIYQLVRKYTLRKKYQLITKYIRKGKILDIGCATGEFLNVFKNNKWDVYGVEPNENARKLAVKNHNLEIGSEAELNELKPGSFDVITMWHVLEHVTSLNERIKEIKRLLKPHGLVFVAVPNCNSYDAKIYKEYWAAYDVPRHLYHFTRESMKNLLSINNFELVKIKAMKFDAYYVSILSEKYKNGKPNYINAIWNGFMSNFKAGIYEKEYSSLIYIFKSIDI